jgi:hypothetical protein
MTRAAVRRHQPIFDQRVHEVFASKQVSVAPSAHRARRSPIHGKRRAFLRIAAIRKDVRARINDALIPQ